MINRRELIAGITGGVVSAGLFKSVEINPDKMISAGNIMALRNLSAPADRTCAVVFGYHFAGDGAPKLVYWDANSEREANQGTVISSLKTAKGRWLQLHNGVMDFRQFGIVNRQNAADAALKAMVSDPLIHRIEAHTSLNFISRHRFNRSNITLDFNDQTVTATGLEILAEPKDNYLSAIFSFRGLAEEQTSVSVLRDPLPLLSEIYPVEDSDLYPVGQWYCLESDKVSGHWERKIQRLVQVTERIDETHIRLNYRSGWALEAQSQLHWRKVTPVENVCIQNMHYLEKGQLPDSSSQPVAFEYAVYCDVINVHAQGTFWSVIFRRWNTFFRTERCSLTNPPTVSWGGAGYLTQQIYCQYGVITDCTASNARHLNDFTASSSCVVHNCHSNGDSSGAFVTHGQYEHDLRFTANSGILTLANSGESWGQSAARIVVSQHRCSMLTADTHVTDLTLTDVCIYRNVEQENLGILRLNCDGLTVQNCSLSGELTLVQNSQGSIKMNVFENCGFVLDPRHDSTISNLAPDDPFIVSHPAAEARNSINGRSLLYFSHCQFKGTDKDVSLLIKNKEINFNACRLENVSLILTADHPQKIVINGDSTLAGDEAAGPLLSRTGEHPVTWRLGPLQSEVTGDNQLHIQITTGINHYHAHHVTFTHGKRLFTDKAFSRPSYFIEQNNIMINTASVVPASTGPHIVVENTEI
ncbi:hypothetical protein [Rahnella aquatilis]|uniref:hypothetical protein n=1 Tax=Rahnella aquatilis TaxID=34038 RepID=UPI0006459B95|nr:hypothetical protein [Rahnella aquatilis]